MSERSESMAERAIREAMERGDFDDLPGAGKPLNLSRSDDPDWFVKHLVEREQLDSIVLAPTVLGLRREAQRFPESLREHPDEATVRAILADYNLRVKRDRLRPAIELPIPVIAPLVDVDEMVARWRALRAADESDWEFGAVDDGGEAGCDGRVVGVDARMAEDGGSAGGDGRTMSVEAKSARDGGSADGGSDAEHGESAPRRGRAWLRRWRRWMRSGSG